MKHVAQTYSRSIVSNSDPMTEYLYGFQSVKLALLSKQRDIKKLFVKPSTDSESKGEKLRTGGLTDEQITVMRLAEKLSIPTEKVSSSYIKTLFSSNSSASRTNQSMALEVAPIDFNQLRKGEVIQKDEPFPMVVALDEIWDPQNLGAVVRSSAFFGAQNILISAKNSSPLSPVVSRASAGLLEVYIANNNGKALRSTLNMARCLEEHKQAGWKIIGTSAAPIDQSSKKKSDLYISSDQLKLNSPTILVLGNENTGLRANILSTCDQLVHIRGYTTDKDDEKAKKANPYQKIIADSSLNVSVACATLLHCLRNNPR